MKCEKLLGSGMKCDTSNPDYPNVCNRFIHSFTTNPIKDFMKTFTHTLRCKLCSFVVLDHGNVRPCVGELCYYGHHSRVKIMLDLFGNINYTIEGCYIATIIYRVYSTSFIKGAFDHNLVVCPKPELSRVLLIWRSSH